MRTHVHEVERARWYTWYFGAKDQVSEWNRASQRGTAAGTPTRELDLYRKPELGFLPFDAASTRTGCPGTRCSESGERD